MVTNYQVRQIPHPWKGRHYYVSTQGEVWAVDEDTQEIFKPSPYFLPRCKDWFVNVPTEDGLRARRIVRLVAESFLPNKEGYNYVKRIDPQGGFDVNNLRWARRANEK